MENKTLAIELRGITKTFGSVVANENVDLSLRKGEILALLGENGSGKTTLMNMLGCLDVPTSGDYFLHGQDVASMSDDELSDIRNREIGFIFQGFNLIPNLTAEENVELPLIYRGVGRRERKQLAQSALEKVGLSHRMHHKPSEMSGGQQQRVAIARALASEARTILADEPTGALDSKSTDELLRLFGYINAQGQTILMVTHSVKAASHAKRVLFLRDGEVFHQIYRGSSTDSELYQKISEALTVLTTGGDPV